MVDVETLCLGCMTEVAKNEICAHCGYPESVERNPIALPERTLLNDRFYVGAVLGKPGGYGITYLAWDLTLQTTAAIKEYLPQRLASRKPGDTEITPVSTDDAIVYTEGLEEFLDEARTLVRFSHPNIVRVRDFFQQNNSAYLVMDYYAGMSLSEHLKQRSAAMTQAEAIDLITPVLDGLATVHELGYLHRDIKPANIYIAAEKTPILLDFGAARHSLGEETESLSVILTPGYAPFEQYFRKGKQGPWTDIYSCAATLYFALSGVRPPPALDRETSDEIVPLDSLNHAVSPAVSAVIMRELSRTPAARSASATAFKDALIRARSREPGEINRSKPTRLTTVTVATSLVLLLIVAGLFVVWMTRDSPSPSVSDQRRIVSPNAAPSGGSNASAPMPQAEVTWRGPPSNSPKGAPRPPRESTEACRSIALGDVCSFAAPHGMEQGTCRTVRGASDLACIPDHHRHRRPPPPRRN